MDSRRRGFLQVIAAGGASAVIARALGKDDAPQGVARLEGSVAVNARPASPGTVVALGDRVSTGPNSQAVIVIGADAFLLRSQTVIEVGGKQGVLQELLVATGRILSVFAQKPVAIKAGAASIGIRGTGAYLEVEPASVYFCLCYGEALVEGPGMSRAKLVKTTHHEEPLILRDDGGVMRAEPGPFQNHSDAELVMLEALVGREPPFRKDGKYPAKQY
jgi:hypothetical protein